MEFAASFALVMPELVLIAAGLVLLLVAAWGGDKAARLIAIAAAAAFFAAGFLLVPGLHFGVDGPATLAFGGLIKVDSFALFAKALIYLAAIGALMIAPAFFDGPSAGSERGMRAEYPVLILFAAVGMSIMVSANDFMSLYLGLELNSLSAYVLAAILRRDPRSGEAGLKYFVLGALASGILLYGMSLLYGFTGGTSFTAVRAGLTGEMGYGALFGVIFVLSGLAFKISAVPFHMWTPDVYEGAPTPVTAFFAAAPKVAAVALTARVVFEVFGGQVAAWQQIVMFMALASIIFGALGAIGQENLKRLLAYSSINNIGFILLGLAVANADGASAMLVYLFIYVAMSLGSFVALLMLRGEDGALFETFADIRGLSVTQPAIAWALLLFMFSLAGIPPLLGFYSKFVVFQATIEAGLVAFGAIAIAASVIGAFYYIKFVKVMFFDEPAGVVTGKSGAAHWVLLGLTALIVSPLGYLLTPSLTDLADKAAALAVPYGLIAFAEQTGSTNADLAAALRTGEGWAEGRWLVARRQTAGRGRQGRAWFDGAGNFMGSTVVMLGDAGPPPATLSFVAALAVRDAAAAALPDDTALALKWPNDVLLDGGKLSGILLEMVRGHIVVGIGVNLAHAPDLPDRKTAALADVIPPPPLDDFAANLAAAFDRRLESWRTYGLGATLHAFLSRSIHAQGSAVTVHDTDGSVLSGSFAGLEESDGALRLRLADGSERVIRAGDIS